MFTKNSNKPVVILVPQEKSKTKAVSFSKTLGRQRPCGPRDYTTGHTYGKVFVSLSFHSAKRASRKWLFQTIPFSNRRQKIFSKGALRLRMGLDIPKIK